MADMHLETSFAGMGADRLRGRLRREELKEVFVHIIDLALDEQVDILLIAGDLFEHQHASRGLIKWLDQQFQRIAATRVFISPGNHDPYLTASYYENYPWAPNVHIFGPEPERVDLTDLPVSVSGWGFGAWEVPGFQLQGLRAGDPGRVNLLVAHGGEGAYHPFKASDLAALGMDYIALGHIHKPGVVLEQEGRVIARYSGSPEALGFGEPGEHGVYLGTVTKADSLLAFVPTGRRSYITRTVDATGAQSLEDVAGAILLADSPERRREHCYRLQLEGAVDDELAVDLGVLHEKLAGEFFFVRLEDRTHPDQDLQQLAAERSARGLFVQRLLAMADEAKDPAARRCAERARALGLAAFEGRPISR